MKILSLKFINKIKNVDNEQINESLRIHDRCHQQVSLSAGPQYLLVLHKLPLHFQITKHSNVEYDFHDVYNFISFECTLSNQSGPEEKKKDGGIQSLYE